MRAKGGSLYENRRAYRWWRLPGLNAVIRGVVKSAHQEKAIEIIGIYDGFKGLMEKRYQTLTPTMSRNSAQRRYHLGTTNRDNPFHYPVKKRDSVVYKDESKRLLANVERRWDLIRSFVIGGDGTMNIAMKWLALV